MTLKQFIEENLNLIEENNFKELYKRWSTNNLPTKLTEFLLSCDINPLLYMNEIPNYYLRESNLTSVVIPNNIKSIEYSAFYNCSKLTNITIPNSVTSIGEYTFLFCNNLTDIYYNGTKKEWGKIHIKGSTIPMYVKIHFKD